MKRWQQKLAVAWAVASLGFLLVGCSSSNVPQGTVYKNGVPSSLSIVITPTSAIAGQTVQIVATVKDQLGNAVTDGTSVFLSYAGSYVVVTGPAEVMTVNGQALASLTMPSSISTADTITVTAISGDRTATGTFTVIAGATSDSSNSQAAVTLTTIEMEAISLSVPADGLTQVPFTATLLGSDGTATSQAGVPVTFSVDTGVLKSSGTSTTTTRSITIYTDARGKASAVFVSPLNPGVATVSATAKGKTTAMTISSYGDPAIIVISDEITPNPNPQRVYVTGSGRAENSTIFFKVLDKNGSPVQTNATRTVEFMILNGGLYGGESLSPGMGAGNSIANGLVKTVFRAGTRAGTVKILAFVQTPTNAATSGLALEGSDLSTTAGSAVVTASRLSGATAAQFAGTGQKLKILFGLDQGSYTISSLSGNQITLTKALTATASGLPYRVDNGKLDAAEVQTNAIEIGITGDLPSGENLSIAAKSLNIIGLIMSGVTDTMTAFLADRFNNPVPTGTSVNFTVFDEANLGSAAEVTGTGATTSDNSTVEATLRSQAPHPSTGFVRVAAQSQSANTAKVKALLVDSAVAVAGQHVLYAGTDGGGVFRSPNSDVNSTSTAPSVRWVQAGRAQTGLFNGYVNRLVRDPVDSSLMWAATNDGVYRTRSSGEIWEEASGRGMVIGDVPNVTVTSINAANQLWYSNLGDTNSVFADLTLSFASSARRSKTKVRLNGELTDQWVYDGASRDTIHLFNQPNLGLRQTVLGSILAPGITITVDYEQADSLPSFVPVMGLAPNPTTPVSGLTKDTRILYAALLGQGFWRSTDAGQSWFQEIQGFTHSNATAVGYDSTNNRIYVGTKGGGVYRCTNEDFIPFRPVTGVTHSALNWTVVNGDATGGSNLLFKEITAMQLVVSGATTYVLVGTRLGGVWVGVDTGLANLTWVPATTNIQAVSQLVINTTVTDLVVNGTTLYASVIDDDDPQNALGGVFRATMALPAITFATDAYFSDRAASLTNKFVHALALDPNTGLLYAGTDGRNVFRIDPANPAATGGWVAMNDPTGSIPSGTDQALASNITNNIYSTMPVLFSGHTQINAVQVSDSVRVTRTGGVGLGIVRLRGEIGSIPHHGTQVFQYTVCDLNGNPLVAGSKIEVTTTKGTLSGDTNVTLADSQQRGTEYTFVLTNNLDPSTASDETATISIAVTSSNGSLTAVVSRRLIKPVQISVSTTQTSATATATASGGSDSGCYVLTATGSGVVVISQTSNSITYLNPAATDTSVTIRATNIDQTTGFDPTNPDHYGSKTTGTYTYTTTL